MSTSPSATTIAAAAAVYSKYHNINTTLSLSGASSQINTTFLSYTKKQHTRSSVQRLPPIAAAPNTRDGKDSKNNTQNDDDNNDDKQSVSLSLDDVNPVGLGRRSRQIFDEVWRKFSGLGQISRTIRTDDVEALDALLVREGPMCEFAIPGAQNTTVLVVGATSRIGRIVVRKLMLRGYSVKALVRKADEEVVELLPRSVEIVIGDVGDPNTVKAAVEGCNKIIYCATARSTITGDLFRVDQQGVYNLSKAFQDHNNQLAQLRAGKSSKSKLTIAKFKSESSLDGWEVRQGTYFEDVVTSKYDGGMDAKFEFTENGAAVFSGYVFNRGGYVELSKKLSLPLGSTLDRYEGLVLSVGGNGRPYVLILEAGPSGDPSQSKLYFARISTKVGFCRVRVPFSSFRPVKPDHPVLDPFLVHTLTIRFEPRRQRSDIVNASKNQDSRSFQLILEYIKALPTGQETDFVLVSCSGLGIEPSRREQVLKAKRAGEDSLRRSGLGYTIVRPGPLQEEPGGQRALIFDQGDRISRGISCADVAAKMCSLSQQSFLISSPTLLNLTFRSSRTRKTVVVYCSCTQPQQQSSTPLRKKNENKLGKLAMIAVAAGVLTFGSVHDASAAKTGGRIGGQSFRSSAPRPSSPRINNNNSRTNIYINPRVAPPLGGGYGYGGVPYYGGGWGWSPFSFFAPGPSVAVGVGGGFDTLLLFMFFGAAAAVVRKFLGGSRNVDDDDDY